MTFFDQIYQRLFSPKAQQSVELLHEPIKRSANYQSKYDDWKELYRKKKLVQSVSDSYYLKKAGQIGDPDVHLLESGNSNGFAISFNKKMDKQEFQYFFDWLSEKMTALNYRRFNSDINIIDKVDFIETRERNYFKPINRPDKTQKRFDQQYGNVLIEYILVNDEPAYIKLIANTYNDHKYDKAIEFEKLAEYLFQ